AHDERFVQESQRKAFEDANQDVRALPAQSAEEVVDAAWRIHGRVDVLVSNDSHPAVHRPVADGDIAYLRATLEKLVVFPFALAKAAIPRLRDQSTARIVFITSNRAHLP